jgi:hypothetical protein
MAYNNAIPQPADQLNTSQPQILANFMEIATALAVNHGAFNGANEGKHMFVELPTVPNAQLAVVPAMLPNEIGLVSQVSTYTGLPEMQVIRPSGNVTVEFTSGGFAANGWTRLPSGILLKWGNTGVIATIGDTTINYPVAANIPVFFATFQTFLTPADIAVNAIYSIPAFATNVSFTVANSNGVAVNNASYLTIGI